MNQLRRRLVVSSANLYAQNVGLQKQQQWAMIISKCYFRGLHCLQFENFQGTEFKHIQQFLKHVINPDVKTTKTVSDVVKHSAIYCHSYCRHSAETDSCSSVLNVIHSHVDDTGPTATHTCIKHWLYQEVNPFYLQYTRWAVYIIKQRKKSPDWVCLRFAKFVFSIGYSPPREMQTPRKTTNSNSALCREWQRLVINGIDHRTNHNGTIGQNTIENRFHPAQTSLHACCNLLFSTKPAFNSDAKVY